MGGGGGGEVWTKKSVFPSKNSSVLLTNKIVTLTLYPVPRLHAAFLTAVPAFRRMTMSWRTVSFSLFCVQPKSCSGNVHTRVQNQPASSWTEDLGRSKTIGSYVLVSYQSQTCSSHCIESCITTRTPWLGVTCSPRVWRNTSTTETSAAKYR